MSDISSSDVKKSMEQPNKDTPKVMENPAVIRDDSNETLKPPKNFSDMPIYVVGLITERLDYRQQLKLRKVSKSLRALVDRVTSACQTVSVQCAPNGIICVYNNQRVLYKASEERFEFKGALKTHFSILDSDKSIVRDDYEKIAFDDLAFTLKNPKLQLEHFNPAFVTSSDPFSCFIDYSDQYAKLRDILESIGHQISCRSCRIEVNCHSKEYYSILPYVKPGVLEKIAIDYIMYEEFDAVVSRYETMKQLSLLDQWKQAKELEVLSGYEYAPMEFATHFKRFRFREHIVDDELLIPIRDRFSKHSNFEYCLIETRVSPNAEQLQSEVGRPAAPNERTEFVSHYSIPDTDDYLEFMFFEKSIEIRKIKKS